MSSAFVDLCARIRFSQDHIEDQQGPAGEMHLAELVARVRAESLQVTRSTAPRLSRTVEKVAERLDLPALPEVYVRADSAVNAFVPGIAGPERPVVILNSGLVKLLSPAELAFPLGHELGHLGLGHSHGALEDPEAGDLVALSALYTSRCAELSADRVGLVACGSTFAAANALLKTASGLPTEMLGLDVSGFVAQADWSPGELSREWELELSHPSLPFRMWAMLRFSHSDTYAELSGGGGEAFPVDHIDQEIVDRLDAMGDGRLAEMEETALLRAVTWAGVLQAARSEPVAAAFEELVGPARARKALEFSRVHGRQAVEAKAAEALAVVSAGRLPVRRRLASTLSRLAEAER